jgi:glycosyltransferase involved in cell wall biosynthesis
MGSNRIRVLFVLGWMAGGGSERQLIGLLRKLDRARFEPLLYLVSREGPLLDEIPADVPVFAFWDDHRQVRWKIPGWVHGPQVRHLTRVLREQAVDVLYDRTFYMTLITGPAARRAGVPRVSTIVTDPEQDLRIGAGRFAGIKRWLLRRAYRQANRVVTVSESLREAAIAFYGLSPQLVLTIRNPLDLERVDRLAAEADPQFAPDRFHVVSAGRLQAQKGYCYLIDAAAEIVHGRGRRELLVHVLGEGPQEQELRDQVVRLGLSEHVRFEGFQINPLGHYRCAQLVCLPSLYEGLPNVLLEAMACRVPVLAADCPTGPREVLDGGRLGRLVPPGDARALAAALAEAMADYEAWKQPVAAARQHIERNYCLEVAVGRLEDLLLEVCRRPG